MDFNPEGPSGIPARYAGCNSDFAHHSITPSLHHSITPSLRAAGFEDEDDDEDSLPDEALPSLVGSFVSERSRESEAPYGTNRFDP